MKPFLFIPGIVLGFLMLIIPACVAARADSVWAGASATLIFHAPNNGKLVTLVCVTDSKGSVLVYAAPVAWIYRGHFAYQASLVTNGNATYFNSYQEGRAAFNKL